MIRFYWILMMEMMGNEHGIGWRRMLYLSSRAGYSTMVLTAADRLLKKEQSSWWEGRSKAALIQRAGTLCKRKGWTLIKTAADDHDMRADVPSIGVETIKQCVDAGCGCIAVGTGRVILLDSPEVIKVADAANIAIVGVAP